MNVRKGIEIGIFTGSSTLCIGLGIRAVQQYDAIHNHLNPKTNKLYDRNDYKLIAIHYNMNLVNRNKKTTKNSKNKNNNNNKKKESDNILDDLDDLTATSDDFMNNMNGMNNKENSEEYKLQIEEHSAFCKIAERAFSVSEISDLISNDYSSNEMNDNNAVIAILSELYSNRANHNSFDFAFINFGDLTSYKEYYTLLIKLIKTDGILLINHTLGETSGYGSLTLEMEPIPNDKNSKKNGKKRSQLRSFSVNHSNMDLSNTDGANNEHLRQHNELVDRLRSFNSKIVSDASEKNLIECCMIVIDSSHSMTLIKKLKRNVGIESSSSLLTHPQAHASASIIARKYNKNYGREENW